MILYIWDEINIPIQKKNLLNIWNTFSLFKQSLPQLTKNNVTEKKIFFHIYSLAGKISFI